MINIIIIFKIRYFTTYTINFCRFSKSVITFIGIIKIITSFITILVLCPLVIDFTAFPDIFFTPLAFNSISGNISFNVLLSIYSKLLSV